MEQSHWSNSAHHHHSTLAWLSGHHPRRRDYKSTISVPVSSKYSKSAMSTNQIDGSPSDAGEEISSINLRCQNQTGEQRGEGGREEAEGDGCPGVGSESIENTTEPLWASLARPSPREENLAGQFPSHFFCSLSHLGMRQPVIDQEGNTYEKNEIELYLRRRGRSPVTGNPLLLDQLADNVDLSREMQAFFETRPHMKWKFMEQRERELQSALDERYEASPVPERAGCCASLFSAPDDGSCGAKLVEEWKVRYISPGTQVSVKHRIYGYEYHAHGLYIGYLDEQKLQAIKGSVDPYLVGQKCVVHLRVRNGDGVIDISSLFSFRRRRGVGVKELYEHEFGGEAAVARALNDVGIVARPNIAILESATVAANCEHWARKWATGRFEALQSTRCWDGVFLYVTCAGVFAGVCASAAMVVGQQVPLEALQNLKFGQ
eukprot:3691876-Rhodomonas_salina.3